MLVAKRVVKCASLAGNMSGKRLTRLLMSLALPMKAIYLTILKTEVKPGRHCIGEIKCQTGYS